jgi:hypothetical protein
MRGTSSAIRGVAAPPTAPDSCYLSAIAGNPSTSADGRTISSLEDLSNEIDSITRANRERRDTELDRRARSLRHLAGIQLVDAAPENPDFATPNFDSVPDGSNPPPEVGPDELTPELLRAAILRHGCLLVRGLIKTDEALSLADGIEQAFQARSTLASGGSAPEGYYEEFEPEAPFQIVERDWIQEGGGVLAVDSPKVMFDMTEAFDRGGVPGLVEGYLGERPGISANKCTLRKAEPQVGGMWHQDGKFLGEVRTLNLWLSLSHCGDEAPGLDIVPRRIDHLLQGGEEGTFFEIKVSDETVKEAAGDLGVLRPIFEPGDALFFDELFLHQTGSDPAMPKPRYCVESWFFGPSAFPGDYIPLAL